MKTDAYELTVWDAPWVWRIRRPRTNSDYLVDAELRTCTCPRHEIYGEHCRHLVMVREALMGIALKELPKRMRRMVVAQLAKDRPKDREARAHLSLRPSHDEEKLNGMEQEFLNRLRSWEPGFARIGIQSIQLKLADDTRYTPDFWTLDCEGELVFWEVKGFMRDDAAVKLKVAARQYSWARFMLVRKVNKQWAHKEIRP